MNLESGRTLSSHIELQILLENNHTRIFLLQEHKYMLLLLFDIFPADLVLSTGSEYNSYWFPAFSGSILSGRTPGSVPDCTHHPKGIILSFISQKVYGGKYSCAGKDR